MKQLLIILLFGATYANAQTKTFAELTTNTLVYSYTTTCESFSASTYTQLVSTLPLGIYRVVTHINKPSVDVLYGVYEVAIGYIWSGGIDQPSLTPTHKYAYGGSRTGLTMRLRKASSPAGLEATIADADLRTSDTVLKVYVYKLQSAPWE